MVKKALCGAILGFGREGASLYKFLRRNREYRSAMITICDKNPRIETPRGAAKQFGKNHLRNLDSFDVIFRSPGIPYLLPQIQRAARHGAKISSETKLFFERCPGRIIGVTGSKGKGTVSTLLYRILKAAGQDVVLAGNVGIPMLDTLPRITKNTIAILELSSFQLQDLTVSPHIAVVLDIFSEHMDYHKNFREYLLAKSNICKYQRKENAVFYFLQNSGSRKIAQYGAGKKIGVREPGDLSKNTVMVKIVAKRLGVPPRISERVIKNFRGLPHRLELVRKIGNVSFYNDSAATNPEATAAAIRSFHDARVVLIAGGKDKGLNYTPLARAAQKSSLALAILFGENKWKIHTALSKRTKNKELRIMRVDDLNNAVRAAYASTKRIAIRNSSFVILFSPASASFDMFRDYAERGTRFKTIVKNIKRR